MLIPFDEYKYTPPNDEVAKPTSVIWLNPAYVISVTKGQPDRFGTEKCHVTMASRQSEEQNDEYVIVGEKDYIAKLINTACGGQVKLPAEQQRNLEAQNRAFDNA